MGYFKIHEMRSQKGKLFYIVFYTDGNYSICPPGLMGNLPDENNPIKFNQLPKDLRQEAELQIGKYKEDLAADPRYNKKRPSQA